MAAANLELAREVANNTNFDIKGHGMPHLVQNFEKTTITTHKRGFDVLNDSFLNKGTATPTEERTALHLWGLLPSAIMSLEAQIEHTHHIFESIPTGLSQYRFAMSIEATNKTLFYGWVNKYFNKVAPSIYTPAVGDACLSYGYSKQPLRGIYLSPVFKGVFDKILGTWKENEVDVVVVTDGGRILGLGDLGAHGMPIPVGKLALYTALAGIRPQKTLPIMLDVGTNNDVLRTSGHYCGWKNKRIGGREYYELVNELILAIKLRWPHCLVQFEDFSSSQAWILLDVYINNVCCFNDDIQGTGSVVAAGIRNAVRIIAHNTKESEAKVLEKSKYIIVGGGSAGYGVCLALRDLILSECNVSKEDAANNLFVMDTKGVLSIERAVGDKKPLDFVAKDFSNKNQSMGVTTDDKLIDVIRKVKPCGIIGLTGTPGMFSEEIVREMSLINPEPIIFPLSNPTSKAECTFAEALKWSNGKCLFGSGSPFTPIAHDGFTYRPSQTNNMYIFPGIGLAAVLSRAKSIPNSMFAVASKVLAYSVLEKQLVETRCLFPGLNKVREISCAIAYEVMQEMRKHGLSQLSLDEQSKLSIDYVKQRMYSPVYQRVTTEDEILLS